MRYNQKLINSKGKEIKENLTARSIFEAAKKLFFENGYCTVTVRDIAEAAGTNIALVSYYYESKDNLANLVYLHLADLAYEAVAAEVPKEFGAAEKFYLDTILGTMYCEDSFPKFYHEQMQYSHGKHIPANSVIRMSLRVIDEYDLQISPLENEVYLTALLGAERFLQMRRANGELNISFVDIADIMFSNYFFNINLPDQTIAKIIGNCKKYLEEREGLQVRRS